MSDPVSAELAALQAAADQARAVFKNSEAESLYAQALGLGSLAPELEYDLLAGRAECSGRLGHLKAQRVDLARMLRIAEQLGDVPRQVKALNAQGRQSFWLGTISDQLPSIEHALALARQVGDPLLQAESLLVLTYQSNASESEAAAAEALRLYQEQGDLVGQAECVWRIANRAFERGQVEEAQAQGRQALALARQSGDRTVEAVVLLIVGNMSGDAAHARAYHEQALALATAIGDRRLQTLLYSNLCFANMRLGLYHKAQRFGEQAVQNARDIGATGQMMAGLDNLALCYPDDPRRAAELFRESHTLAQAAGASPLAALTTLHLGRLALAQGKLDEARVEFEAARDALAGFDNRRMQADHALALAWLGMASLAEGDWEAADRLTADALSGLTEAGNATDEAPPQDVYWCRWQVLRDPAAPPAAAAQIGPLLDAARQLVLEGIATLSDAGLRRNYLNKVRINRELLLAWDAFQAQPKPQAPRAQRRCQENDGQEDGAQDRPRQSGPGRQFARAVPAPAGPGRAPQRTKRPGHAARLCGR